MVGEDCSEPPVVLDVDGLIRLPFLSYCTPFTLCRGRLCLAGLFRAKPAVVVAQVAAPWGFRNVSDWMLGL